MASLYSSLVGLREEIAETVAAIVPASRPETHFVYITPIRQGDNAEEQTSLPRRFFIEYLPGRRETFGSTRSLRRVEGYVVVGYPKAAIWNIETDSDSESIARALDALSPVTTDVEFVKVLDEMTPETTDIDGDYRWIRTRFYSEIFVDQ